MLDRMVDTDTTKRLKGGLALQKARPYLFCLTEHQVTAVRAKGLPDSALAALGAIAGAVYAARGEPWVTLSARTLDCYRRSYRWWNRATTALQAAGLIECQRHAGRLPRYRLAKQGQRAS